MKLPRPVEPMGSVNVLPEEEGFREIEVCTLLDPELLVADEKFAKAVMALDASRSMIVNYGNAYGKPNMVQLVAHKIGKILATRWSTEYKISLYYWAVGVGGQDVERVGEFDETELGTVEIRGVNRWGTGTKLLPAIKTIIEDESGGAERTLGVVITDGVIEDETECVAYLTALAKRLISENKPNSVKLVLIGIGDEVDRKQLERLDDFCETIEELKGKIDLFSSGIAEDWSKEHHILGAVFGELISEDKIIAEGPSRILDAKGKEVVNYSEGLPGRFRFHLPHKHKSFTLCFSGKEVAQDISEALE